MTTAMAQGLTALRRTRLERDGASRRIAQAVHARRRLRVWQLKVTETKTDSGVPRATRFAYLTLAHD